MEGKEEPTEKEHDPYFEPIISLPEVNIPTLEENETVLICLRGKLYRMDSVTKEWKERGTGEIKLLHDPQKKTVRVVMRRDKTLKICANHYITGNMILKPSHNSDRAWVWGTQADITDGVPKNEILAVMFLNSDIAKKWEVAFENAKTLIVSDAGDSTPDKNSRSPRIERDHNSDSSSSGSDTEESSGSETPGKTEKNVDSASNLSEDIQKKLTINPPDLIKDL